ncbi:hypothetical protein V8E54_003348 [Elaphomyces granulatus]
MASRGVEVLSSCHINHDTKRLLGQFGTARVKGAFNLPFGAEIRDYDRLYEEAEKLLPADGLWVQVDISIALVNMSPIISSVAFVILKTRLLIFGQNGSIDRLAHQIIPKQILRAEGSNIRDDMWGKIILEE